MSFIAQSSLRRASLFSIAVAGLLLPFAADARFAAGQGHVAFNAQGPAGMTIVGTSDRVKVTEDQGNVKVTVPLGTLTTGIALRDNHMHEKYLQVQTYPNAEFSVARASLKIPAGDDTADSMVSGTMTIHGKSRPATIHYKARRTATGFHVTGDVGVNMNDYGIEKPSYLGVSVKPDVVVSISFDAADAP